MRRKRALVFGKGLSGNAALQLLQREDFEVAVLDGDGKLSQGDWDFAVVSPGIPLSHPWVEESVRRNIPLKSELQVGADAWGGKMLAVTGSKGKSSVVKFVADTLNAAGMEAVACGNYGVPLCAVVNDFAMRGKDAAQSWAVVEVSSFQMETTHNFHPCAAALLNIQEDHLDRHGSIVVYEGLKRELLRQCREDGGKVIDMTQWHCEGADLIPPGCYFDNPVLRPNGAAGALLLRAAGVRDEAILKGFADFKPLPHRMETVCEAHGVVYIDDSKATSFSALAAGVQMAGRPVRLIAGGLAKGDDPKKFKEILEKFCKKVYLIGNCAKMLREAWRETVETEMCGTVECAVETAASEAQSGEAVLLSPGTASFDQFKNYAARGETFKKLVCARFGVASNADKTER